jgi:hypothetical protein
MKLFRHFVIAATACLALAVTADLARADGFGCRNCGGHGAGHAPATLFQGFGFQKQKQKLPVFQAAPWYQYWPYDAHFLTPAPVAGPFYGPPLTGNFPINPYFPGPAGPVGFGPLPGGPMPVPPIPGGR